MPGKVAVALHHVRGRIEVVDDTDGCTDVGTIVGSGDTDRFPLGSVAILERGYGKRIGYFRAPSETYRRVLFLGDMGNAGIPHVYDPSAAIMAVCDWETKTMRLRGERVLIARDDYVKEHGGLIVPDTALDRTGRAMVLEQSTDGEFVPAGSEVIYHAGSIVRTPVPKEFADKYPGVDPKSLAFLPKDSVYAIVEP